jgi:hypothetical protein
MIVSNLTLCKFFSISYQVLLNIQVFWNVTMYHWAINSWVELCTLPGLLSHEGEALHSCQTSGIAHLTTQHHIPYDLKLSNAAVRTSNLTSASLVLKAILQLLSWKGKQHLFPPDNSGCSESLSTSCHLSCVAAYSRYVYRVTVVSPEIHKFLLLYLHTTATATYMSDIKLGVTQASIWRHVTVRP